MKIRTYLVIIVILVIIGIGLYLASSDVLSEIDNDNVTIANDNFTFVVGISDTVPPFTYEGADGNYTGFDVELAKEVCDRRGWHFVEKPIVWNEKNNEINSGNVDCVWASFTINGREDQYTWSEPYIDNKQVAVVKSDSGINSLSDLSGKVVEVLEGSSAEEFLNSNSTNLNSSFYKLVSMKSYREDFDDLDSSVCDAIVMNEQIAEYMIHERGDDKYKILRQELCSEQFGIGFKKGNTDLRDQVQETLNEMFYDGTVEKIAKHYSDYGIEDCIIYPE